MKKSIPLICALALLAGLAFVPSLTDFNSGQFSTGNNKVNIASGALVTNLAVYSSGSLNSQVISYGPSGQPVLYIPGFSKPLGTTGYWNWDSTASAWTFTSIIQWTNSSWTASALLGTDANKAGPVGVAVGTGLTLSGGTLSAASTITSNYVTLNVTNGINFSTNSWAGPTNTLDLSLEDQYFQAGTDCSITGVINKLADRRSTVLLTITNSATTNITLRMAGLTSGDGSRAFVVTNAAIGVVSISYSPVFGQTNFVERNFW